jgi:hypothetical protein
MILGFLDTTQISPLKPGAPSGFYRRSALRFPLFAVTSRVLASSLAQAHADSPMCLSPFTLPGLCKRTKYFPQAVDVVLWYVP